MEPLKVKDGSQPYKFVALGVCYLTAIVFGMLILSKLDKPQPLGLSTTEIDFATSTQALVTCPLNTSTVIQAATPERQNFILSLAIPNAGGVVSICRATTCVSSTAGIILVSTTNAFYEQKDAYKGPYSCVSGVATSSVGVTK